ncbi:tetratricopeptide repeat protein [Kribbella sp. NPDC054772]
MIRKRQAGAFVGRTEPLRQFEQNLALPPDDPRRRFIFTLYGDAGIGKTTLVRQWQRVAVRQGHATGYVDEAALDIPSAIEMLARSLAAEGAECEAFTGKLTQYRKHRHTVDSDPGAPSGISSLLTRSAVRIGLRAAEGIPVVGAFTGEIDKNEAALQADQARAFLARRFARHQDIELLLAPVDVLTAAFAEDLQSIGRQRPIALFVDTFERTGQFLNDWLLELLEGRHGGLPPNLVISIAGQRPLDANLWADYLGIRTDVELEVFTATESRHLLATRGIDDTPTVDVILKLSGGLPVLVATLAESSAARGTTELGDPSETAVDRFLKWEPDRDRRAAAVSGALPRRLDREVLTVAGGTADDFDWLRRLPFVVNHTDGYRYHDVVRGPMLRSLRREAPNEWTTRQHALAAHYETRRGELGVPTAEEWNDSRWRELKLEESYHYLCATGTPALPSALSTLIEGYGRTSDTAAKWARMIEQAGRDTDLPEIQARGEQLATWLQSGADEEMLLLSSLAADASLDEAHRGLALAERSQVHERLGDFESSLRDLDKAASMAPDRHWIIGWRGFAHFQLGNHEQALADLTRAIELRPRYEWAFSTRSDVHQTLGQYEAALADIDRALEIDPADALYFATRASIKQAMGRFADAVADYDQALVLAPDDAAYFAYRGDAWYAQDRHPEALADLDRSLELEPQYTWALTARASVLRSLNRTSDALADVNRALAIEPDSAWALFVRALIHLDDDALAEAQADLSAVLSINPQNAYVLARRGDLLWREGRLTEALRDLDQAIELEPALEYAYGRRAEVHRLNDNVSATLADLDRAVELDPEDDWALAERGDVQLEQGRYRRALDDLSRAVAIDPDYAWAISRRAEVQEHLGDLSAARLDHDRAVDLAPEEADFRIERGRFLHRIGDHAEALSDFTRVIDGEPDNTWAWNSKGEVHQALGDDTAALAAFERVLQLDPTRSWSLYRRALIYRRQGREAEAQELLRSAIQVQDSELPGVLNRVVYLIALGDQTGARELLVELLRAKPFGDDVRETADDLTELGTIIGADAVAECSGLLAEYRATIDPMG